MDLLKNKIQVIKSAYHKTEVWRPFAFTVKETAVFTAYLNTTSILINNQNFSFSKFRIHQLTFYCVVLNSVTTFNLGNTLFKSLYYVRGRDGSVIDGFVGIDSTGTSEYNTLYFPEGRHNVNINFDGNVGPANDFLQIDAQSELGIAFANHSVTHYMSIQGEYAV